MIVVQVVDDLSERVRHLVQQTTGQLQGAHHVDDGAAYGSDDAPPTPRQCPCLLACGQALQGPQWCRIVAEWLGEPPAFQLVEALT